MNSIDIIGRLTREPETTTTKAGHTVCRMRVAVPRPSDDTEPVYVDVVAWDRLAETCSQYVGQGRQVAVSGRLDYSEWNDADGNHHSRHEVIANQIDFLAQPRAKEPDAGE